MVAFGRVHSAPLVLCPRVFLLLTFKRHHGDRIHPQISCVPLSPRLPRNLRSDFTIAMSCPRPIVDVALHHPADAPGWTHSTQMHEPEVPISAGQVLRSRCPHLVNGAPAPKRVSFPGYFTSVPDLNSSHLGQPAWNLRPAQLVQKPVP